MHGIDWWFCYHYVIRTRCEVTNKKNGMEIWYRADYFFSRNHTVCSEIWIQYGIMSELVRMADKLVEIASENWPALRDLYDVTDPNTYYGHCTVENYIQWLKKEPLDKDYSVYSLNGEWSDGTYLIVVSRFHCCRVCSLFSLLFQI